MPEGREAPHPCGHAERQRGCGGCDPGAVEFVIEDGTGEVTRFCCMKRDQYGECSHVQAGRERSVADLAMEQGVEPFDPDTFQPLDLTDEEREGLDAALAAGREATAHCATCVCGRRAPVQSHHRERGPGTIAWWEHEQVWAAYAGKYGSSQSAERIAERGGFGWGECVTFLGHKPTTWSPRG